MSRPLRILVAEDDPGDVLLMERALSKTGVEVPIRFVNDGQQAIDYLKRKPPFHDESTNPRPTLVLLDLKMPRMSGFDVLKWVRRHHALRNLLVVVFTSSEDPEDMRRAYSLGADSYLVKPQDPADFIDSMRDLEKHWLRANATPECGFVSH